MTRSMFLAAAAFALAACATDQPPANPQNVVDQRVAIMKGFASALGASSNFVQGKGTQAAAKAKLSAARADLERVVEMFPRGTALGDRGVTQSRTLTTVFANRSDFEEKFGALDRAFAALDEGLAKNKEATSPAVAGVKAACTSCHNKYRAPED